MGNKSSKPSTAPTGDATEIKDVKQISLDRMISSLDKINAQLAIMENNPTSFTDEHKKAMIIQRETVIKAIKLLQDPNVTFNQYMRDMGALNGGSKKKSKSRAKKSKSRAKKSKRSKKHRS